MLNDTSPAGKPTVEQERYKGLLMNFRGNLIWRAVYSTVLHRKQVDSIQTIIDSLNPKIHATAEDVIAAFDGLTQLGALVRESSGYKAKVTQFLIPEDLFSRQEQIDIARDLISQVNSLMVPATKKAIRHATTIGNRERMIQCLDEVAKVFKKFELDSESGGMPVDGYYELYAVGVDISNGSLGEVRA